MRQVLLATLFVVFNLSCGRADSEHSNTSHFLVGNGWEIQESPYMLPPGSTIGVCNSDQTKVSSHVIKAVRLWLDAGGRDERIAVRESCQGTRVIFLNKLTESVDFYGRAYPLSGNVHNIDVAPQWAGHWTANHEIGHVFGFAHIFEDVVSIMNSADNGKFMNGGYLSDYDHAEIKRMLQLPAFQAVNALWAKQPSLTVPTVSTPVPKKCLGVDGKTLYGHGVVTRYQGNTFTCIDGLWKRG